MDSHVEHRKTKQRILQRQILEGDHRYEATRMVKGWVKMGRIKVMVMDYGCFGGGITTVTTSEGRNHILPKN